MFSLRSKDCRAELAELTEQIEIPQSRAVIASRGRFLNNGKLARRGNLLPPLIQQLLNDGLLRKKGNCLHIHILF
jgi:hypothetical protein